MSLTRINALWDILLLVISTKDGQRYLRFNDEIEAA